MLCTTLLVAIQMHYVKKRPVIVGFGFLLVFGFFDGLFWGASLRKVPHGAWVPLMIGMVL
jgi:KUP system potassium uptake protein